MSYLLGLRVRGLALGLVSYPSWYLLVGHQPADGEYLLRLRAHAGPPLPRCAAPATPNRNRNPNPNPNPNPHPFQGCGRAKIVGAGYALYSASTELVLSLGGGTVAMGFTLDPARREVSS